ncbi:hypothetical protein BASA81_013836 [Batrachochytrium salamandrivorans]|nr:hypothetical protein BASA81_013836 [Batrachochytrium salamandrivorans]
MASCVQFQLGRCAKGLACKFVHENGSGDEAYFYGELPKDSLVVPASSSFSHKPPLPSSSSWAVVARLPHQSLPPPPSPLPTALPQTTTLSPSSPTKCSFYSSGKGCRFGAKCRFVHDNNDNSPPPSASSLQCGICLEPLPVGGGTGEGNGGGRRIGLLTDCSHLFCYTCISNWRRSDMDKTKHHVQNCPVCRTRSYLIVPVLVAPASLEEKQLAISTFRTTCKQITCKYGADCPFGSGCLYYHSLVERDPARLGLEYVQTADGTSKTIVTAKVATLGDFILH